MYLCIYVSIFIISLFTNSNHKEPRQPESPSSILYFFVYFFFCHSCHFSQRFPRFSTLCCCCWWWHSSTWHCSVGWLLLTRHAPPSPPPSPPLFFMIFWTGREFVFPSPAHPLPVFYPALISLWLPPLAFCVSPRMCVCVCVEEGRGALLSGTWQSYDTPAGAAKTPAMMLMMMALLLCP